ncbi:MAG: toxin-antitoxin system YwqK family antitoxin [bacterium]
MHNRRFSLKQFPARWLRFGLLATLFFSLTSCAHKQKVVEESYPDGTPKRECIYRGSGDKKILLSETFYYPNGQVQVTGGYKNGQRNGYWKYFYENGNLWSEGYYKEGKNHGKRLTYFENGKLRYEAWYDEDERTGIWKFYDTSGKLIKEVDYSRKP